MKEDPRVYPVAAPGWAALDRVLRKLHPGRVPHQFASRTPYEEASESPLPAVTGFAADGPPHWHLVGYGCSELFDKTSPHADVSGFGFEVGVRVPRTEEQDRPPAWAVRLLQRVGHHVLFGGARLDSGHLVGFGGPVDPEHPGGPDAAVVVPDPALGKVDTPNGSVLFLVLLGLYERERAAMESWPFERRVRFAWEVSPKVVTDPSRPPFDHDPRTAAVFRRYGLGVMVE